MDKHYHPVRVEGITPTTSPRLLSEKEKTRNLLLLGQEVSRRNFLAVPENMNFAMADFDGENVAVHFHVAGHAVVVDVIA